MAEAQALWEISMLYIALAAAARATQGGAGAAGAAGAGGFRASQLLARAYYRLVRAAFTGHTIADRTDTPGDKTSLRQLYSDFETLAYRSIPRSKHADTRRRVVRAASNYRDALSDLYEREADLSTDDDRYSDDPDLIEAGEQVTEADGDDYAADDTEDLDWSDDDDILVEELEKAKQHLADVEEAERQELLELQKRIKDLEKEQKRIDRRETKRKREAKAELKRKKIQAAKDRGKIAAAAMKAAQEGGRSEIAALAAVDGRAIGFVIIPKGPHPCYWCLMLASRGINLRFKSAASARATLYHDNCKCSVEAIFDREHYFSSPTFARTRAAHQLWEEFKKKGGGRTDPKVWRSHFDTAYRSGKKFEDLLRGNARKQSTK